MSSKNKSAPALHIEYLPLDELLRWPGNPKEHAEEAIAASVTRFGFRDPLAIDEATGRLIAGHGRLTVLERARAAGRPVPQYVQQREDGMWLVPVTRGGSFGNEEEASAYLVAHNRARGEHGVLPMAAIVRRLRDEEGLTAEEVMQRCGMEREEVTRLYERGGMTERGTVGKEGFSKGWTPTR